MNYTAIGHDKSDYDHVELWAWVSGRLRFARASAYRFHDQWDEVIGGRMEWSGRIDHKRRIISIAGCSMSASQERLFDVAIDRLAKRHPNYAIWGRRGGFKPLKRIA